jgi:hypothetical protein
VPWSERGLIGLTEDTGLIDDAAGQRRKIEREGREEGENKDRDRGPERAPRVALPVEGMRHCRRRFRISPAAAAAPHPQR